MWTHNCIKIQWQNKGLGSSLSSRYTNFFFWWTSTNVLNVKSPPQRLSGLLSRLNSFFFSLFRRNSLGPPLSVSLFFCSLLFLFLSLRQCLPSIARPSGGTAFLFVHFVLDFIKNRDPPVLTTAVIVYCSRRLSVACFRSCRDTFIVVYWSAGNNIFLLLKKDTGVLIKNANVNSGGTICSFCSLKWLSQPPRLMEFSLDITCRLAKKI